jgi:hypothetical protein
VGIIPRDEIRARFAVTNRRGRRPGQSGTREAILVAAERQFAELGYDRTSLRSASLRNPRPAAALVHYDRVNGTGGLPRRQL